MSARRLNFDSVPQSSLPMEHGSASVGVIAAVACERCVVVHVAAFRDPRCDAVAVDGLLPGRHYHVRGAAHPFCRADGAGRAVIGLTPGATAALVITSVI